jgi:hypothetical protein
MNVKFSNVKYLLVLLACLFAFYSCDKVKDASTTEIKLDGPVSIKLDNIVVIDGTTKSTANEILNYFSGTKSINLTDLQGLSEEAIKYRSNIESVEVGSTSITITTTDSAGTVVKEFLLTANGVANSINVPQYDLGSVYSGNMQDFTTELLMKLFSNSNGVTMNTSGKTDITAGEKLEIEIILEDITLIANLL